MTKEEIMNYNCKVEYFTIDKKNQTIVFKITKQDFSPILWDGIKQLFFTNKLYQPYLKHFAKYEVEVYDIISIDLESREITIKCPYFSIYNGNWLYYVVPYDVFDNKIVENIDDFLDKQLDKQKEKPKLGFWNLSQKQKDFFNKIKKHK